LASSTTNADVSGILLKFDEVTGRVPLADDEDVHNIATRAYTINDPWRQLIEPLIKLSTLLRSAFGRTFQEVQHIRIAFGKGVHHPVSVLAEGFS